MVDQTDTSGPAYPVNVLSQSSGNVCDQLFGMSLLDHYAGLAMQAVLASPPLTTEKVAAVAFDFAEAMIAERKKRYG